MVVSYIGRASALICAAVVGIGMLGSAPAQAAETNAIQASSVAHVAGQLATASTAQSAVQSVGSSAAQLVDQSVVSSLAPSASRLATASTAQSAEQPATSPTVFAYGHTDSPKAFWDVDASNLTLKATQGETEVPLDDAIHWLHRAYSGAEKQSPFYFMTVPEDQRYSFLGEPGDQLYAGFAENSVGSDQPALWIGFGADAGVPVEQFRDQAFMLQMLDFQGPGDMEIFRRGFEEESTSIRRYLSSKDLDYRATMLTAGSHTHLVTTFTKPGRYQMAYRTALRGLNGAFVYSATQVMTWQVGGNDPVKRGVDNVGQAWNALPQTANAGQSSPAFTVSPVSGSEPLTHFEFTTGNSADTGTAVLTIDGLEMAQIPVAGGKASWDEMIGSADSTFNVIYLPGAGSVTGKWVSAPIMATTGKAAQTVTEMATEFPQAITRQGTVKTFTDRAATSRDVSLTSTQSGDSVTITLNPADPTLELDVVGGFGSSLENAKIACPVDFHSGPDSRTFVMDQEYLDWCEGGPHFQIIPAPEASNIAAVEVASASSSPVFSFATQFPQFGAEVQPTPGTTQTPAPGATHEPEPGASQNPGQPAPNASQNPTPGASQNPGTSKPNAGVDAGENPAASGNLKTADGQAVSNQAITITDGHIDVGPFPMSDGGLKMLIKDDSRQGVNKTVLRDPASVTLQAAVPARERGTYVFRDKSFDFLGTGKPLFVISQTQVQGVVWPGFSTEHLPNATFPKGATINISAESMPAGAQAFAFTENFGKLAHLYVNAANNQGGGSVTGTNTHLHVNWVFTKPGTYRFAVSATAATTKGAQASAPATHLTLVVKDPNQAGPNSGDPNTGDPNATGPEQPQSGVGSGDQQNPNPSGKTGENGLHQAPGSAGLGDGAPLTSGAGNQLRTAANGLLAPLATTSAGLSGGAGSAAEQCIPTQVKKEVSAADAQAKTQTQGQSQTQSSTGGSYTIPANTHVHPNWVFTQAGTYKVTIRQSATVGGQTLSGRSTLTFNVGGQGNANEGHFDVGAMIEDGQLIPVIKDDRTQPAKWVQPESLTFGLGQAAQASAPAGIEFVANAGSQIWMIGSAQVAGVPWVGANTMHPSLGGNTPVTWTLESVQGPGKLAVFTSGNFGQAVGEQWFSGSAASGTGSGSGGVVEENGKFYRMEWVGKTPSGADCQLSAAQLATLGQGGGASLGALPRTGSASLGLLGITAVLVFAGCITLTTTPRRNRVPRHHG